MVISNPKDLGRWLRIAQIIHTTLLLPFLVFIGLSPAFKLKLESGQEFRIAAIQGPIGQVLLGTAIVVIVAQILSSRRALTLGVIGYAGSGSLLIFVGLAVPAGEKVLNSEIENVARIIAWMGKEINSELNVADLHIQTGLAWNLMVIAGVSLLAVSATLLAESKRLANKN
jgi:hypothetical protein